MNKEKKNAIGSLIFHAALFLLYLAFVVGLGITQQNLVTAITLAAMLASVEIITMGGIVVGKLLGPHLACRRAAIKALGEHGLKKVMKDPAAKAAYQGVYAMMEEDYPKAEERLNLAMGLSGDVRQNQLFCIEWLIKLYEQIGTDEKLLWCYRKAVELAPDNSGSQIRLGHAYYVDGRLDNALYCFEQALRYDPNNGYALYSTAKIQMIRGEDDKALETLETLKKTDESHPLVYEQLAIYYAMHGDREKCMEAYQKAQFCGYKDPEELNLRITAIFEFGQAENVSGEHLPREYYRRIEKKETQAEKD